MRGVEEEGAGVVQEGNVESCCPRVTQWSSEEVYPPDCTC